MNTSHAISATSLSMSDPTYADLRHLEQSADQQPAPAVRPFGIARTIAAAIGQAVARRRADRAELAQKAKNSRALASDARMRAEFDAHFMGF